MTEKPPPTTVGHGSEIITSEKPTEGAEKQMSSMRAFIRIFTYGTPTTHLFTATAVIAACGSGVALALVNLVIGNFITLLGGVDSSETMGADFMAKVSKQSLYFVYIGIARFVLIYVYSTAMTYSALVMGRNLRRDYLRSALRQDISFFDHGSAGSISMQAVSNGKLIQSGTSEKLGQMIQAVATFVAAFAIAFVSQWKLTLILLCIVPALVLMVGTAGGIDAGIETSILKIHAQAGSFAESSLGNVRAIIAFSLGPRIVQQYGTFLDQARSLGQKKNILYGLLFAGEYFVMFAGMGLAFWQGIAMMARGQIDSIGTVFTVLFSVVVAGAMLNSFAPNMVTFTRAATAASELFALIDRVSAIDPLDPTGEKPTRLDGTIDIRGLSFSYPTRPDITIFDNFSLHVPAGKVTALVGSSGSGKSTVIGLLERWYNPDGGAITIDGISISKLNIQWLRTNIRLVQQEPVLFNGTVFENIRNGLVGTPWEHESHTEQIERVKSAAKTAFAHDFIEALSLGYDTRIGERGGLLSGGQKQRVAIARSIISEPRILLLDEATSALDPHAEAIVQRALDEASKNRTTIVVAHKLKTIQTADNIVVMKQGKVVEQGQHDQLVARQGVYASLVKAQSLSPVESAADPESSDSEKQSEIELTQNQSLSRQHTASRDQLSFLNNREDYSLSPRIGIISTVMKLVSATPDLKWWYVAAVMSCVAGAGVYPAQALLLGNVMDIFSPQLDQNKGNFFALMFFVIAIGLLFVYMTMGWSSNHIAQACGHDVRKQMFAAYLRQDLSFFDRPENTIGALTSRLDSSAQSLFELMGFNIALIVLSVISVVACAALSIAISWKLGLVGVLAGIPPMIIAGYIRVKIETKMDIDIEARFSNSASIASESVTAIRTISSLALEQQVVRRYTDELDTAISNSRGSLIVMMLFFALTQSVEFFVLALGFWWGSKLISTGAIGFYQFIVSFMSVYFCGQGCATMFTFTSSVTKANSAANYFFWLCNLDATIRETGENKDVAPPSGCTSYSLHRVQFAYPLAPDHRVLKGVSLDIRPGQFVAFVGASGCGKSTMISLLERFYDPISGHIMIDGARALVELNPRLYRRAVSFVQQEPTLFPVSIRENVSMGVDLWHDDPKDAVDDAAIETACRAANVWDFVCSLPDGLNTSCGSGGAQLSGGQRQRIAIARALIRNPRVILLDEATSALDTESERIVQGALMDAASAGDRITIAVAHRLSTITRADCIFVFQNGRIIEKGTHADLYAEGGTYTKMCEAQNLRGQGE